MGYYSRDGEAPMIAKDLKKFEPLHRRSVRVIWYKEKSRLDAIREKELCTGQAFSHEEIVQYIMTIIPQEDGHCRSYKEIDCQFSGNCYS